MKILVWNLGELLTFRVHYTDLCRQQRLLKTLSFFSFLVRVVVPKWLPLHPMLFRQALAVPQNKGTVVPFPQKREQSPQLDYLSLHQPESLGSGSQLWATTPRGAVKNSQGCHSTVALNMLYTIYRIVALLGSHWLSSSNKQTNKQLFEIVCKLE